MDLSRFFYFASSSGFRRVHGAARVQRSSPRREPGNSGSHFRGHIQTVKIGHRSNNKNKHQEAKTAKKISPSIRFAGRTD
jgi:hypothetical protein